MGKFVLIACLSIFANYATADLSHGYKYNQGHSSGGGNFLETPTVQPTSFAPTSSGSNYFSAAPAIGQTYVGAAGSTTYTGSSGSNGYSGSSGYTGSGYTNDYTSGYTGYTGGYTGNFEPIITKHFYLHSAPEDHDEQDLVRYINVGRPQKNYRVIFIDTPSSNVARAKIIANVAPVEDKTAIYVLSKKTSALDINAEVVTQAPIYNKPEVFYIKYKTPEEAVHAKHTIQAQYDQLGGSSDVIDQGPIPISSVIGSLGGGGGGESHSEHHQNVEIETHNVGPAFSITHTGDNTQQTYLPSK